MDRSELQHALTNANVRAFLRVIREGETDQTGMAYKKLVGDPPGIYSITDLSDHPRQTVHIHRLGINSTAAGAYQFLVRTWDGLVKQYGFEDFSPSNQDEAAVALIHGRGVLDDLISGNLDQTLAQCSWEWASLPPPRYGQGGLTLDEAHAVYDHWGGDA